MNKRRVALLGSIATALLASCNPAPPASNSAPPTTLTVAAAASLQDAMSEIKPDAQQASNAKLAYSFSSSGSLQQQIEQGAPVDVFISAAAKQMNALEKKGLLASGTRKNLLSNQVMLITPRNNAVVTSFRDLTRSSVKQIAVGDPQSVPAGKYAQEVLTAVGIYRQLQPKFVYGKDVRQVLSYVETGNADAGIVYISDTKKSNKVRVAAIAPEQSHSPVVYPLAVLKDSKNPAAAKKFVQFLTGQQAKTVFERHGFTVAADAT